MCQFWGRELEAENPGVMRESKPIPLCDQLGRVPTALVYSNGADLSDAAGSSRRSWAPQGRKPVPEQPLGGVRAAQMRLHPRLAVPCLSRPQASSGHMTPHNRVPYTWSSKQGGACSSFLRGFKLRVCVWGVGVNGYVGVGVWVLESQQLWASNVGCEPGPL